MTPEIGTVLITGANSGIGREIAFQLAARGARLILACRDGEAGARAVEDIRWEHEHASVELRQVDVASRESIRTLAFRLRREGRPLDVLVNNAGVHVPGRRPSPDGVELTFATNVLGYFLTSLELLDLLEAGAEGRGGRPARIVNVASTFALAPDLEDLQFEHHPFDGSRAYAQSKACNRMLTRALARRVVARGVTVNAMAPGLVQTGLFREVGPLTRLALRAAGLFRGRTVQQGADTAVWLATDPGLDGATGGFYQRRQEVSCQFRDEEREERLWSLCEELTGSRLAPA
ncbi:MAG: SDR family NAD(P)-dependent oxidoreductase [bacterium]|jgi:NAD(P)-dependent dehydrogenase (short-subunit alcohol dehydrogenase family)|nr:SDR family NAD(P)-dependent oxidoreductase [bacterium]